jgi:hypothetical protein
MEEWQEVRLARRGMRLVQNSGMDFSVLNVMWFLVVIAMIIVAIGQMF